MPFMQDVKSAIKEISTLLTTERPAMPTVCIVIAVIVLYLPMLRAEFVYDDLWQIDTSNYIHQLANIIEVITLSVMKTNTLDNNRPVMLLSLMADSMIWGRKPFGYHLTNLLLHTANSVMLFFFIYSVLGRLFTGKDKVTGASGTAFFSALVFAMHPVNSEAVCVPTFREDLLVVFFTLIMLNLAGRFPFTRKSVNILYCLFTAFVVFVASASKETGIVSPLLLLFYRLVVRRGESWRLWSMPLTAGFISAGVFAYLRFTIVPAQAGTFANLGDIYTRLLQFQPRIWAYQLLTILWPDLLSADYNFYSLRHITLPVALVILIVVFTVVLIVTSKNRAVILGVIFYIVAILPTSNLMSMYRPMADRYLYFPMAGFCVALGSVICCMKRQSCRGLWLKRLIGGLVLIYLGIFLVERVFVWQNSRNLWQDVVKKNPYSIVAFNNLGNVFYNEGQSEKALIHYRTAIEIGNEIGQSFADPYAGMAVTYEALGNIAEAEEYFLKAVAVNENYANLEKNELFPITTRKLAEKLKIIADRVATKQKAGNK